MIGTSFTSEMQTHLARVLVVEDEIRLRDLLADVIPEMGFPTTAARSAEEAMRLLEAEPFDIAVLDLQLPLMSGLDLLEQIRDGWPGMQAIILTGFGDLATAQRAIHLDVVEFLSKPCHLRDLELALDRARRRLGPTKIELAQSDQQSAAAPQPATLRLAEVERQQILEALRRNGGNRTAAAAELGISRRKLHYRLAEYRHGDPKTDDNE